MAKTGRPLKEDAKRKQITIRFDDGEYARLTGYASKSGKALTQVVREGLELLYQMKPIS